MNQEAKDPFFRQTSSSSPGKTTPLHDHAASRLVKKGKQRSNAKRSSAQVTQKSDNVRFFFKMGFNFKYGSNGGNNEKIMEN